MSIVFLGAAIATILTALLQVVEFPWLRLLPGEEPGAPQATPTQEAPLPRSLTEEASSSRRQAADFTEPASDRVDATLQQKQARSNAGLGAAITAKSLEEAASPSLPIEFTLEDGEQEVLLGGQAAAAIEFSRVGEMELVTLRIHTDGSTRNHALLSPGGRYEFAAGGETYLLSILRLDTAQGRAVLRIDSKRP
ncbi:MAG TPA: hypothetical protein VNB06_18855 [Thermoanaerobaculia bacterium]|nr:hypothetical protein [Thermoanaerobaculia bacterium]